MKLLFFTGVMAGIVMLSGCAMPSKTAELVAGPNEPPGFSVGSNLPDGSRHTPVSNGAEGSAAGGYEVGRIGGPAPQPIAPAYPPGRMSPIGASGSGDGDLGHPIPPNVSLQAPPDPVSHHS